MYTEIYTVFLPRNDKQKCDKRRHRNNYKSCLESARRKVENSLCLRFVCSKNLIYWNKLIESIKGTNQKEKKSVIKTIAGNSIQCGDEKWMSRYDYRLWDERLFA